MTLLYSYVYTVTVYLMIVFTIAVLYCYKLQYIRSKCIDVQYCMSAANHLPIHYGWSVLSRVIADI